MSTETEPVLGFAGYVLDTHKRLLTGPDGQPVNISSRAFDTCFTWRNTRTSSSTSSDS